MFSLKSFFNPSVLSTLLEISVSDISLLIETQKVAFNEYLIIILFPDFFVCSHFYVNQIFEIYCELFFFIKFMSQEEVLLRQWKSELWKFTLFSAQIIQIKLVVFWLKSFKESFLYFSYFSSVSQTMTAWENVQKRSQSRTLSKEWLWILLDCQKISSSPYHFLFAWNWSFFLGTKQEEKKNYFRRKLKGGLEGEMRETVNIYMLLLKKNQWNFIIANLFFSSFFSLSQSLVNSKEIIDESVFFCFFNHSLDLINDR